MEEASSQIKILLSLQLAEGKYLRFYYFTSVSLAPKKVFQINTKDYHCADISKIALN